MKEFKVHKNTIIFKINIFKLIDKHPNLMKSSITLGFLKNYFKHIKLTIHNVQKYLDKLYSECCKIFKG